MSKFYNETTNEVLENLNVKKDTGLSQRDIILRSKEFGKNEFTPPEKDSLFKKLKDALTEPLILILIAAAVINFIIGESAIGIIAAIILGTAIGLISENKSDKATEALSKMTGDIEVKALRDNQIVKVHKSDLVPGDIVFLETGDMVPADGRLINSTDLKVREDMLTGESDDVKKDSTVVVSDINDDGAIVDVIPALQTNMVFGGTLVASGKATMVVTTIGDNTEMGKIAQNLGGEELETPLQAKLGALGSKIAKVSSIVAVGLFGYMMFKYWRTGTITFENVKDSFTVCVALIVAAVPEGLPTMVNMTLAITMQKMSKINALVTKKDACETIGSISVICSDKTGTLTQNRMTVEAVERKGRYFNENCLINSTADISYDENNQPVYMGSATECALLLNLKDIDYKEARKNAKIVAQEQFSSATKQMSTTIEIDNEQVKLIKGAPEVILETCTHVDQDGTICPITEEDKKDILENIGRLQVKSMRCLGFAYEEITTHEGNIVFSGFVGIKDPLRPDVKEAVKTAKRAGVATKMLTGDNINTARAIGEELGLLEGGMRAVESSYIDSLTDEQLKEEIKTISIVGRSKPDTKMRIVQALQSNGEVVAVTGDGVNDAPALSKADVGIAMGIAGTEVSKNAADIILTDDSFSTIVKGIQWGRGIFENFQRFVQFQLTVNVVAFLIAIVCTIFDREMPFTTTQLLWVNIIMDGPPALALGLEPVRKHVLNKMPIARNANIITKSMLVSIIFNAIFIGAVVILQEEINFLGATPAEMETTLFALFAFFALFNALNAREFGADSIVKHFFKNTLVLKVLAVTAVAQIVFTNTLQSIFDSVALSPMMWVKIIITTASIVVVNEIVKFVCRLIKK